MNKTPEENVQNQESPILKDNESWEVLEEIRESSNQPVKTIMEDLDKKPNHFTQLMKKRSFLHKFNKFQKLYDLDPYSINEIGIACDYDL